MPGAKSALSDEDARTGTSPHCQQCVTAALLAVGPCAFPSSPHTAALGSLPGCDTDKGKGPAEVKTHQ